MDELQEIDSKTLSKAALKLIEKISGAISLVYQPTHIRRIAKAKCGVKIIQAKGQLALDSLEARTQERLMRREVKRQLNMESIITKTISFLFDSG